MNVLTDFSGLNGLAIAAAAVASHALGGMWFTVLFGKAYARALGRQDEPTVRPTAILFVGPFVCGLAITLTSALLIQALKIQSMANALAFGSVVGMGYLASTTVCVAINPNIPRPLFYGLVSGSYFLLSSLLSCAILVAIK